MIAAITSEGSNKCHVANVFFELAPTVTAKTSFLGKLDLKRARNISGCMISKDEYQSFLLSYLRR